MPDENGNPITFKGIAEKFQQLILETYEYPEMTIVTNGPGMISGYFLTDDSEKVRFRMRIDPT